MARLSSSSNIFARRGDPWVTRREGVEDFGRKALVAFEDPDIDQFTKAERAPVRFEPGPDKPIRTKSARPDNVRRKANILNKMHRKMREAEPQVVRVTSRLVIPPPTLRSANVRKATGMYSIYVLHKDGKETEEERKSKRTAERLFSKYKVSPETIVAELWSPNGDMVASFDRREES